MPSATITSEMPGGKFLKAEILRKKGKNVLNDAIFNKGLGFPRTERDRLGIRGLVPPSTLDQREQGEVIRINTGLTADLVTDDQGDLPVKEVDEERLFRESDNVRLENLFKWVDTLSVSKI